MASRAGVVMPEKVKMTLPDGKTVVDGISVGVKRSIEQWSEFELEDGSKFKGKLSVAAVNRATNSYDPMGRPPVSNSDHSHTDTDGSARLT